VHEVWDSLLEARGDDAPTQEDVLRLLGQLNELELLQSEQASDPRALKQRRDDRKKARRRQLLNPFSFQLPLADPTRWLTRLDPLARWLFRPAVFWLWLAVLLLAGSIGLGVGLAGSDPLQPFVGALALALYGAALAGIGLAIGGLVRPSLAGRTVAVVAIGTFLVDILAPALRLPDWVQQLALSSHMGEPMVGTWDVAGIVACLALAIGGLALGAWGMNRRNFMSPCTSPCWNQNSSAHGPPYATMIVGV